MVGLIRFHSSCDQFIHCCYAQPTLLGIAVAYTTAASPTLPQLSSQ